ncbi:hypothetical protein EON66_06820 [archaeon]|nr:MAG: hypothetical protein EON66_06820 [archaeon]
MLLTEYGEQIEAAVMNSVQALMSKMDAHGVPDAEFRALLETLTRLTEDDMGDYALQVMRQMSLTRTFDVRQAREMVITIGSVSPFDQIEAAVLLYDKVMNKESYPLVLACFDDATDRANICHRLGITIDGKGCIVATRQKAAVKAT